MDVPEFLAKEPYDNVLRTLATLSGSSDPSSITILREFLKNRDGNSYTKFITPRIVCLALLQKGPSGVQAMLEMLPEAPGAAYPRSIVEALWFASEGRSSNSILVKNVRLMPPLNALPSVDTVAAASRAIDELIARALEDERTFYMLLDFLSEQEMAAFDAPSEEKHRFRSRVFESFAKGKIKISESLLAQLNELISRSESEETYQCFLETHPVLLDPLASEVIPKQRLGSEHITDFVIRRLDSKYVLVEIEKPQDVLFTGASDFSAKFTHAFGQIIDFQQWIDSHGEYARSLLPGVSSPSGLLIIGTGATFSDFQRQKLHRFNVNSANIQVLTFDDVVRNGRRLYENIYRR